MPVEFDGSFSVGTADKSETEWTEAAENLEKIKIFKTVNLMKPLNVCGNTKGRKYSLLRSLSLSLSYSRPINEWLPQDPWLVQDRLYLVVVDGFRKKGAG
jgi:hypothetical protein